MPDERDPRYCFTHNQIEEDAMSDNEIGWTICAGCGQPVSTLNGRYGCTTCGANG